MSDSVNVTVGVWRNHDNGMLTLTLPEREAGYLSAFLVFFVGLVGSNSWSLAAFTLHQSYASRTATGGLRHQLQIVIRNTETYTKTAWQCLKLIYAWRRQIGLKTAIARSWVILMIATIFLAGWTVAAIFISRIWTDAGDQFLVQPDFCGFFAPRPGGSQTALLQQVNSFNLRRVEAATTYVAQCYAGQNVPECGRLPVPRLSWEMRDHNCPFPFSSESLCTNGGGTPVRFESYDIDSNNHLGVNSPFEERIRYRKTATCSPVELRYGIVEANGEDIPYDELHLFYGDRRQNGVVISQSTFVWNAGWRTSIDGYRVFSFSFDPYTDKSLIIWQPNTTIVNGVDPKVATIFFLDANELYYFNETNDPWFQNQYARTNPAGFDIYVQTAPIRVLSCIEENTLCNPTTGRCTKFTPSSNPDWVVNKLALNTAQTGTFSRLMTQLIPLDLSFVAERIPNPLLASRTVLDGFQQAKLPDDQWRTELARWFTVNLQLVQAGMIQTVTRPSEPADLANFVSFADDPVFGADCRRQRVRNAIGFFNFNFSALIAVVVVGLVLIVAGLTVDKAVGFIQERFNRGARARTWWLLDGIFQVQRLAYQGIGVEPWDDVDKEIPTTRAVHRPLVDTSRQRMDLEQLERDSLEIPMDTVDARI